MSRQTLLLGAALLFTSLTVQVASAGQGGDARATVAAAKSSKKQFRMLKRRVASLEQEVAAVGARPVGSAAPSGPAGGALTGTYPNPAIAADAVGTNEVDGTLTGADIDESTLGIVPNADLLDGMNSTDFASSAEVHTPSRLALDDPTAGDNNSITATLVDNGSFQVVALCVDNLGVNNTDVAEVGISFTNSSLSSRSTDGVDWDIPSGSAGANVVAFFEPNAGNVNRVESANFIAVPESGDALSGFVSAELNDPNGGGSDCTFGASLIGD